MRNLFALISILICNILYSQINLVPNYSFEDTLSCPPGQNSPLSCSHWYRPFQASGNAGATSDYFNECGGIQFNNWGCDVSTSSAVPQNCPGYQYARTGKGYCGLIAFIENYGTQSYKEYIGSRLKSTLVENKTYCVEFYVSLSDSSRFAVEEIAAFFGPDSLPQVSNEPLNIIPQVINNNGIIDNKSNWIKISGKYKANGDEKYIFIGSYNPYSQTTVTELSEEPLGDSSNSNHNLSYYYVDDVSVCIDTNDCNCFTNQDNLEISKPTPPYVLPNIFTPNEDHKNDHWTTNFINDHEYVIILNRWGNEIITLSISSPLWNGKYKGRPVNEGTYFYKAWMRGELRHGTIQVIR